MVSQLSRSFKIKQWCLSGLGNWTLVTPCPKTFHILSGTFWSGDILYMDNRRIPWLILYCDIIELWPTRYYCVRILPNIHAAQTCSSPKWFPLVQFCSEVHLLCNNFSSMWRRLLKTRHGHCPGRVPNWDSYNWDGHCVIYTGWEVHLFSEKYRHFCSIALGRRGTFWIENRNKIAAPYTMQTHNGKQIWPIL